MMWLRQHLWFDPKGVLVHLAGHNDRRQKGLVYGAGRHDVPAPVSRFDPERAACPPLIPALGPGRRPQGCALTRSVAAVDTAS